MLASIDANEGIVKRFLDDEDFRHAVLDFYVREVYELLRREAGEDVP